MVKPESFTLGGKLPRRMTRSAAQISIKQLDRATNGAWFVTANLTFEFELRDGRVVTATKQVRIRGQQTGTKPHKGGFKKKG